jgi:2-dehydropantoate 2-reductase
MVSFAPGVGAGTSILPLLNGMRHLDALSNRFGAERVLGGLCVIGATLSPEGEIIHLNDAHGLTFGERNGGTSPRVQAIAEQMAGARFTSQASANVIGEMWEKWVFLATLAGATCLMRASAGDIEAAPGGRELLLGLFDECSAIAVAEGHPPREAFIERTRAMLTAPGSPLTASMLRDIESGGRIESDHIIGDLMRRGSGLRLLPIVQTHLKAYESRRERRLSQG